MLDLSAIFKRKTAHMGDKLAAPEGARVALEVRTAGIAGGRVELVEDGKAVPSIESSASSAGSEAAHAIWTSDGQRHWFLPEVFGPAGKLWLLGNPVYVNWPNHR